MYRESNIVHEIDVIEMFKLKRLGAPIYIVFIALMVLMWSDGVELYIIEIEEIQLSSKYANYANIFLEEEVVKFLESTHVKHAIPIKEGVEVVETYS
jgi:NhaP-type Na+/H+ and K+/H+ antiporter